MGKKNRIAIGTDRAILQECHVNLALFMAMPMQDIFYGYVNSKAAHGGKH